MQVGTSLSQWATLPWRFRLPQKQVHPQPSPGSLPHAGINLARSLGLPTNVTHAGLTLRLGGCLSSWQDQACSSLGFTSAVPAPTPRGGAKAAALQGGFAGGPSCSPRFRFAIPSHRQAGAEQLGSRGEADPGVA